MLLAFPLNRSKEVNELVALISDIIRKEDKEKVHKLIVFIKEIL